MKKTLSLLVIMIMACALVIAACGGNDDSGTTTPPAGGDTQQSGDAGDAGDSGSSEPSGEVYKGIFSILGSSADGGTELTKGGSAYYHIAMKVIDLASEYSNGRIDITLYPDGSLINTDLQNIQSTISNNIQVTWSGQTDFAELSGIGDLRSLNLPFVVTDLQQFFALMDTDFMQEAIKGTFDKLGLGFGGAYSNGFSQLMTNKEIRTPDDLKGLKIRASAQPITMAAMEHMGGSPVPVDWSEVYTALQQKTVDGSLMSDMLIKDNKFYEVCSHLTLIAPQQTANMICYNMDWFNSMDDECQAAWLKACEDSMAWARTYVADVIAEVYDVVAERGMTVYQPTADEMAVWRATCDGLWEEYADSSGGYDMCKRVMDWVDEYNATH